MVTPCLATLKKPIWEVSFRFLLLTGSFCAIVVVFVQSYLFFSTPIVISPGLPATPATPPKQVAATPKQQPADQVQGVKPKKKIKIVTAKQKKKKLREAASLAAAAAVPQPVVTETKPVRVTVAPPPVTKVTKKKNTPAPSSKHVTSETVLHPAAPKTEIVKVDPPKAEKMTSIVKPRIKEQHSRVPSPSADNPIKKAKDINVVKPELRQPVIQAACSSRAEGRKPDPVKQQVSTPPPPRSSSPAHHHIPPPAHHHIPPPAHHHIPPPPPPALPQQDLQMFQDYRLSEKLRSELSGEKPEISEQFEAAVQEEKRLRNRSNKFMNSWGVVPGSSPSPQQHVPRSEQPPAPQQQPTQQPPMMSQYSLFNPLTSVDDWFAPNAANPFSEFALLPNSRQTSRFQSLFQQDQVSGSNGGLQQQQRPSGGGDIWGPIRYDAGLDGDSWKTE
eukprot:sb/3464703/